MDQGDTLSITNYTSVLLAAWLVAAPAGLAGAQQPGLATGSITGVVTGESGGPVGGVQVTAQSTVSTRREFVATDADGRYLISGLPAEGEYQVSVAVTGFTTAASERVALVANGTTTVNFTLKLLVTESVGVTAISPLIDRGQSDVQQTVSEQMAHALPLAGRNFIPLATLAAGFTGNPNYPTPQGQQYWTNNVMVDGASHFSKWRSAPRTFYSGYGLESIREVRVMTNRFSAEYGEAMATVTTAVTRSGSDQVHGSALFFVQDDALYAQPVFAASTPPAGTERYGVTVGGPIAKQRTHFFTSYEGRRARNHNVVTAAGSATGAFVPDDEDEHLLFLRADHRHSLKDLLTVRYNGQWFRWHNEPGGLTQPGSGIHYRNDVHTALGTHRWLPSGRIQNEARVQFARYVDVRTDLNPTVFVSYPGYSQSGGTLGPFGYGANPEDTWEGTDIVSVLTGTHSLRIGGSVKSVRAHNTYLNYGRGAYFFTDTPRSPTARPYLFVQGVAQSPESTEADPRALSGSGFIQDDWRLRRALTLNLGLRYDVERISNVTHYDAGADLNNVQPRVGVAWEPWPTGRMLVRGGFGLYSQQHLLLYINRVQLEGPGGTVNISLTPESPLFPTYPNVLPGFPTNASIPPRDIHQVADDFHNPYALQATAGVERLFGRSTLSIDYVYLSGRDLMSMVDANAPASIVKPGTRTVAEADATRPLRPVNGGVRNVFTLGNEGRSWYRALQVKAERTSGRLQGMATYTLAHADDRANYVIPEDSRNLGAEKARADTDVRHNVTIGFTWEIPGSGAWTKDWALSGIGVFRSSRPYTITWGDDRNGTTQNDARPGGRNTAETGAYRTIDLAVTRRFTIRTTTIEARAEAFNLLDAVNYDQFVGSLLSPYYAQPVSAFAARRVQLAAVVRF